MTGIIAEAGHKRRQGRRCNPCERSYVLSTFKRRCGQTLRRFTARKALCANEQSIQIELVLPRPHCRCEADVDQVGREPDAVQILLTHCGHALAPCQLLNAESSRKCELACEAASAREALAAPTALIDSGFHLSMSAMDKPIEAFPCQMFSAALRTASASDSSI
ncbi:hypothetical protein [Mycolicibacterium thermoresistibile]